MLCALRKFPLFLKRFFLSLISRSRGCSEIFSLGITLAAKRMVSNAISRVKKTKCRRRILQQDNGLLRRNHYAGKSVSERVEYAGYPREFARSWLFLCRGYLSFSASLLLLSRRKSIVNEECSSSLLFPR